MAEKEAPEGLKETFNNLWNQETVLVRELVNVARNYTSCFMINKKFVNKGQEISHELGTSISGARLQEQIDHLLAFKDKLENTNDPDVRLFAKDGYSTLTKLFEALSNIDGKNDEEVLDSFKPAVAPIDPSWMYFRK